MAVFLLPVWIS